jgi:hypothetical protein
VGGALTPVRTIQGWVGSGEEAIAIAAQG